MKVRRTSRYSTATSRPLYRAIEELELVTGGTESWEGCSSSTGAEAALPSLESNEGELGKPGGAGADTNPPEDQGDAAERVEVA